MFSSRSARDCQERNAELCQENSVVQPLLTDLYQVPLLLARLFWWLVYLKRMIISSLLDPDIFLLQITMAYAYWKSGKVNDVATFDLFFRKNPFKGEFTIFAGLGDCLKFLENFHYSETDITYLRSVLPSSVEEEFYEFLQQLSPREVISSVAKIFTNKKQV